MNANCHQTAVRVTPLNHARDQVRDGRKAPWQTLLVPVDFSAGSLHALEVAITLARCLDGSILLLHVMDPFWIPGSFDSKRLGPIRTEVFEDTGRQLVALANRCGREHVPVQHHLLEGEPYPIIVGAAAELRADLIVIGSEGRTGVNRFFVGSVAEKVVRHARCPVLVARQSTRSTLSRLQRPVLEHRQEEAS